MTRALPLTARNAAISFSALLLLASSALTGCYTQLKGSGDRYGYNGHYHEPVLVHSDTIRKAPTAAPQEAPKPVAKVEPKSSVIYDTVMKGDTMFNEERTRTDYSQAETQPINSAETIINNYYGGYEPYDDYWWHTSRPRVVIAVTFGYPYGYWYPRHYWHSYYSPWYDYGYYPSWWYGPSYAYYDPWYGGWYNPWYGPGFYPPLYDAYSPYYGYGGYYGRHHGYYGYGGGYYGGTPSGRVPHYGRINTGERHGLVTTNGTPSSPNVIAKLPQSSDISTPQVVTRDMPVHNTVPDRTGNLKVAEQNPATVNSDAGDRNGIAETSPAATTTNARPNAAAGIDGAGSVQSAATPQQKHVIVVRRRAPQSGSYTPSTGQSNSSQPSSRQPSYSAPSNTNANTNSNNSTGGGNYSAPRNEPRSEPRETTRTTETPRNNTPETRSNNGSDSRGSESHGDERSNDRSRSDDGPRRSR